MIIKGKISFIGNKKFINNKNGSDLFVQSFVIEKTDGEKLFDWNKFVVFETLSFKHQKVLAELKEGSVVSVSVAAINGSRWVKDGVWQGDDWNKKVFLRIVPGEIEVIENVNSQQEYSGDGYDIMNGEPEDDLPF